MQARIEALFSPEYLKIWTVILAVLFIHSVFCMFIIFRKSGKHGWTALIPIWNQIILYKLFGRIRWMFEILVTALAGAGLGIYISGPGAGAMPEYLKLVSAGLVLASVLIAVITGLLMYRGMARGMNRGSGFGLGLLLLWPVFISILAFSSKSRYLGNIYTGTAVEDTGQSSVVFSDEGEDDFFTEEEISSSEFHSFEGLHSSFYTEVAKTEKERVYTDAAEMYSEPAEKDAGDSKFLPLTYEAEENEEYKAEIQEAVAFGKRYDGFVNACFRKEITDVFSGYVYEIVYVKGTETLRFITDVLAFDPTKLAKYHLYCDVYEYNDLVYAVNFSDQRSVSGEVPLGTNFSKKEASTT